MTATVVAILNPKGGAGKTTLATNLARSFQAFGDVLLIDTDPQQSSGDWSERTNDDYPSVVCVERPVLAKEVPKMRGKYTFIFIDGVGKLESNIADTVKAADVVLIPVQPSGADVWAASSLVDAILHRQTITEGTPKAAFIISRQIQGTNLAGGIAEALEQFDLPVFENRTAQRVAYAEALTIGSSVLDHDAEGKAAIEIQAITEELTGFINGKD
jgi:chromosome partitioning protein